MKKFQYFSKTLLASFLFSFLYIGVFGFSSHNQHVGNLEDKKSIVSPSFFSASIMDISIIPSRSSNSSLSEAFRTGNFDFSDILEYGIYLIKMGGILAGVVYMLMNVWAGIRYITGSISAEEEEAKNTMVNALLGFSVAIFSWIIVDILIAFVT